MSNRNFRGASRDSRGGYYQENRNESYGGDRGRGGGRGQFHQDFNQRPQRGGQQEESKSGYGGQLQVQVNYFKYGLRNVQGYIYAYSVDFGGAKLDKYQKASAVNGGKNRKQLEKIFGGLYLYFENTIYTAAMISEQFDTSVEYDGQLLSLTMLFKNQFSLDDVAEQPDGLKPFIYSFMRKVSIICLLEMKYQQVGRLQRFFNGKERKDIAYDLVTWPGYDCNVKQVSDGIYLSIDTCTKFLSRFTILEDIDYYRQQKYSLKEIEDIYKPKENEKRHVVITLYNSRTYQLDGITFDLTPKTYKFQYNVKDNQGKRLQVESNMVQYFHDKHGIQIEPKLENQPLLFVHQRDQIIYLPPSLCYQASLPDDFTKDRNKMRELANEKISNPQDRFDRILKLTQSFQKAKTFDEWGIKIQQNMAKVRAKKLPGPKILDHEDREMGFEAYEKKQITHIEPVHLKKETWAVVYYNDKRQEAAANNLNEQFYKASKAFGIRVEDPYWVPVNKDYITAMRDEIVPNLKYLQIVVVIINNKSEKVPLKQYLDKIGAISQFLLLSNIENAARGNKIGVFSNILKQINAKVGQDLFRLNLPALRNTMLIGVDVVNQGRGRFIGCCATSNEYKSKYFTRLHFQPFPAREESDRMSKDEQEWVTTKERAEILSHFMQEAINNYQAKTKAKALPEQIVIFRDGCGGPTLMQKVIEYEVKNIVDFLEKTTQGYQPNILYCLVNRNISTRIFDSYQGQVSNPGPGTLVDTAIVEYPGDKMFDFFLIPHKATVATAQPVHFNVVYNTTQLVKEQIETITNHLCYNYFNFQGPIKVPAVCMYAHKIAQYALENKFMTNSFKDSTNTNLSSFLHYL